MGWSRARNVMVSPSAPLKVPYEAGDKTPAVTGTLHLYAVLFNRNKEGSVTLSQISAINTSKYSHIIMVGDSRFVKMSEALEKQGISLSRRTVAKYRSQMDIDSSFRRRAD